MPILVGLAVYTALGAVIFSTKKDGDDVSWGLIAMSVAASICAALVAWKMI